MSELTEYLQQQTHQKRSKIKKRITIVLGLLLITFLIVMTYGAFKPTIYRSLGLLADKAGNAETSENLEKQALDIELRSEAESAFGTNVVTVVMPAASFSEFSRIALDFVPLGTSIGTFRDHNGDIKAYVSKACAIKLQSKIKGVIITP